MRPTALIALALVSVVACERPPRGPDVILITVDTWRADRLPLYGGTTFKPGVLDAWAAQGVVFDEAIAPAPWTWPTLISIASGVMPSAHGVTTAEGILCDAAVTLPEVFRDAGWTTVFAGTNPYLQPRSGIDQGFGTFEGFDTQPTRVLLEAVQESLTARPEAPLFLWLHLFEPHCPFDPEPTATWGVTRSTPSPLDPEPAAFAETVMRTEQCFHVPLEDTGLPLSKLRADYLAAYDAELRETDAALGAIERRLRSAGRWDEAWVVVAGDHGEEFGERGTIGHGESVHREVARVPYVIRPPKSLPRARRGERVSMPVSLTSIPATLTAAAGLNTPPSWTGRSLAGLLGGRTLPPSPRVDSETALGAGARLAIGEGLAVITTPRGRSVYEAADPVQKVEVPVALYGASVERLSRPPEAPRVCAPVQRSVPPDQAERLKSLGYLGD